MAITHDKPPDFEFAGEDAVIIKNYPSAKKLILVNSDLAQRISDLFLHLGDLEFAKTCLKKAETIEDPFVQKSLFTSCLIYFFKCFGKNQARFEKLVADKIFKNQPELKNDFDFFKLVRDKNTVHDENSFTQCVTTAVLNHDGNPQKIEDLVCVELSLHLPNPAYLKKLYALIDAAWTFTNEKYFSFRTQLAEQLEQKPHQELDAYPRPNFSNQVQTNMQQTRPRDAESEIQETDFYSPKLKSSQ